MTSLHVSFIALSAALTGFSPVVLRGTGMTETYADLIDAVVPSELRDRLLASVDGAGPDAGADVAAAVLADPDLAPVARNLIMLWYCGSWTRLPEDWRERHGAAEADVTGVLSSASYQAGLQWSMIGAHPAGARQQGFGSWAHPPFAPTAPVDLAITR